MFTDVIFSNGDKRRRDFDHEILLFYLPNDVATHIANIDQSIKRLSGMYTKSLLLSFVTNSQVCDFRLNWKRQI